MTAVSTLINVLDAAGLETVRKQHRLDPERIRLLRNRLFKKFLPDAQALADFPAAEQLQCHSLELFRRVDSEIDGATKLLFKTATGMLIEAVILRIATGRNTVCVSSQVGCAAACQFCATGKMGIAQNLPAADILDQVLQAGQLLAAEGRRLHNVVFMGMGEPLHNLQQLSLAIESLTAPHLFARSPGSLLVSTVGIADAMLEFATRFPKVNLALSLHSANQAVRESIIPLAHRYPLEKLRQVLQQINSIQHREIMIEYLMLQNGNDSAAAAAELVQWLQDLQVHVNLIPYNPIDEAPELIGSGRERITEFADHLKAAGLKTTVRYSLGSDIAAACGQLVRQENRQRKNP